MLVTTFFFKPVAIPVSTKSVFDKEGKGNSIAAEFIDLTKTAPPLCKPSVSFPAIFFAFYRNLISAFYLGIH